MRRNIWSWIVPTIAVVLLAPYGNAQERGQEQFSDAVETARLRSQAEALRVPLAKEGELRSEGNVIGFRSPEALFSRRIDSRTYFIQDLRPTQEKETRFFQGPEKDYTERLSEVFRALEIPAAEIAQAKVMQEQTQEGQVDRQTGKLVREEPRPGKRWALATRQVEGVPVFSSRALMGLSYDGRVSFLELHWPLIPANALLEAHRLQYKVRAGWRPPALEGAHVESVEAGIVHSPAVGFCHGYPSRDSRDLCP